MTEVPVVADSDPAPESVQFMVPVALERVALKVTTVPAVTVLGLGEIARLGVPPPPPGQAVSRGTRLILRIH